VRGGRLASVRFAAPLVSLVLVVAACSSSSNGGAPDSGPDVPTSDATYVPPTPCTCPAGQQLLLFGPPGWCAGSAPAGGASCGVESCFTPCGEGGVIPDAAGADAPADDAADAATDAAEAATDAASDAPSEAAADATPDAADAGAD
jgi:hypothetical protein